MHPRHHTVLSLACLAALGPLAFDAFLPALPALGKELGLPIRYSQSLLAVYMAALASAHLLAAWAANALGKRAVLIAGALLLAAGSAVCALAYAPWELQAGRILQGLGVGAAASLLPLLMRTHSSRGLRLLVEGAIPIMAPFTACATPLAAGALKAAGQQARAGLALLQFASHAAAAAAIQFTAKGDVEDAALITFGSAALMVIAGGAVLPFFIWQSKYVEH